MKDFIVHLTLSKKGETGTVSTYRLIKAESAEDAERLLYLYYHKVKEQSGIGLADYSIFESISQEVIDSQNNFKNS